MLTDFEEILGCEFTIPKNGMSYTRSRQMMTYKSSSIDICMERPTTGNQQPKCDILLGFNRECIVNRPESVYPPSYVEHRTFFLDSQTAAMSEGGAPSKPSSTSYVSDSWDDDGAHFVHTFSKYTELIGFSQAKLFMSRADTDDLDIYVICRQFDAAGKPLVQLNIPLEALPAETTAGDVPDLNVFKYIGPNGRLRASHRELSAVPSLSKEQALMLAPAVA